MGTGVGRNCLRCGEQLNYDDGFTGDYCDRCYSLVNHDQSISEEKKEWEKDFEVLFGDVERKDYIKAFIQDLLEQELDKASEEGQFTEDEKYHLVNLLKGGIQITDSISQAELFNGILSKLKQ